MGLDLSGVNAKIERAYAHLQALDAEIETWIRSYPYGLRHDVEDEGREHAGVLEVYLPPDGQKLGLLVGDSVQNFRSALDHLVYTVAKDSLDEEGLAAVEGRLAFPICTSEAAWETELAKGRLDGLSGEVQAVIQRRQPYHALDPTAHDLAVLHWLNNRDKHRVLHAFAAFPRLESLAFIPELPGPNSGGVAPGPYQDGAEVFRVRTGQPSPHMQVQAMMLVQVRVRDAPEHEEVRELLGRIGASVRRAVAVVAKVHEAPPAQG
jgi:hypothetical protein